MPSKRKCKDSDARIEEKTGISREKHENRNEICNEMPTGKIRVTDHDHMLYLDDAGREWRRNPDIFSSYHQPMSMPNALFHSLVDMLIFCVDFPVPNMKFIALNDDQTYSEIICNRYTGELIVDPRYFGTSNFCTDAPMGMLKGSLTTKEHIMFDVKAHEKYGDGYKQISKGIPCGHYDGSRPHPIILHDPQGGPKAKYMSKENDPNYNKNQKPSSSSEKEKKGEQDETPSPAPTLSES